MKSQLADKRICITGGGGFLGRRVVARLHECRCDDVFIVRKRDYDLVRADDVERLFGDTRPQLMIHLAAVVGGIGANRETRDGSSTRTL
jgi:GDP-L-fucose synthase